MNVKSLTVLAILSLLATISGAASAAYAEDPDKWKFDAQIYLWGASMGVDSATGNNTEVSFGDLLDDLEMAFMGSFAAQKGKWAMLGDVIYLDLEHKESTTVNAGPGLAIPVSAKIGLDGWVVNLMGGYAIVQRERNTLFLVAGALPEPGYRYKSRFKQYFAQLSCVGVWQRVERGHRRAGAGRLRPALVL